jgi:hypothetical protein
LIFSSDSIKKSAHDGRDNAVVSAEQWKFRKLPNLHKKCCTDIYSADETGLFYCVAMDASLSCKWAAVSGAKKLVDYVTVLCCAEMSETK